MAKTWMLPACFEHFGVLVSNHHFSLTAVSKDGTIVVVAMWEDEFERRESRTIYQTKYRPIFKRELRRGSKQRISNLNWARSHCDGLVRVVVLQAEDNQANPRTIKSCYPNDSLIMRITHLNTDTGVFRAESVESTELNQVTYNRCL